MKCEGTGDTSAITNLVAIIGDCFADLHDWIFTEQYLDASLNLPIIIKLFGEESSEKDFQQLKAEAKMKVRLFAFIFYGYLFVWAIVSVSQKRMIIRMQHLWTPLYQVVLIFYSLRKLRALIIEISVPGHKPVKPNTLTITLTVAIYLAKSILGVVQTGVFIAIIREIDDEK